MLIIFIFALRKEVVIRVDLYWENPDGQVKLYLGDARNLDAIPDESVDMIATSPPYW